MDKARRAAVIAGNWKMNKTASEAAELYDALIPLVKDASCEVVTCVPFTDIAVAVQKCKDTNIKVGAENCHFKASGAYTGEISAPMLTEAGVNYVIVGHSERRQYFGETDETVNLRARAVIDAGMKVIICVGETLEERELGITEERIGQQIKLDLHGFTADDMKNVIIAYEPIWAIGTGKTATALQAEEVCGFIRTVLVKLFGVETAESTTIQYGGSMKPANAAELLAQVDIDGGLIGGAALKADDFAAIVKAASEG
ncbi:MAG: triose-phosphate isomerase [Oscillospiraceae bacterium]|jgi:triosephosphate isomerase